MRIDRSTARIVVPPILALGLVAALMDPLASASPTSDALATTPGRVAPPAAVTEAHTGASSLRHAGSTSVDIPAVLFAESIVAVDGHLRTPVLLADRSVSGSVRIVGAGQGNDCRGSLTPGTVTWLDCTVSTVAGKHARVIVALSDGRRVTAPIGGR